jgi:hypothetical protein
MLSPSLHLPIGGSPCVEVGKAVCYTESSDSPKEGGGEADESREKRIAERWWRLRGHQDDGEGKGWEREGRGELDVVLQLTA